MSDQKENINALVNYLTNTAGTAVAADSAPIDEARFKTFAESYLLSDTFVGDASPPTVEQTITALRTDEG